MHIVIVGNSAAGLAALETINKTNHGQDVEITMISKEVERPFSRVLIPYFLRGKTAAEHLFIRDESYYSDNNCTFIHDEVVAIDEENKTISLKNNESISYDKLLLSTGASATRPPIPGIQEPNIFNVWTYQDSQGIQEQFLPGRSVLVIGSGFVALQAAWAAKVRGLEVKVVELADRVMPTALDPEGSKVLRDAAMQHGVDVETNKMTKSINKTVDGRFVAEFADGTAFEADLILVGAGVRANTGLTEGTSIELDRGIKVDAHMRTTATDIFAAGDNAQGPSTFGEKYVSHALWPTAVEMGQTAAKNMLGLDIPYQGSLNMNVTEMYEVTVGSCGIFQDVPGKDLKHHVFPAGFIDGYLKFTFDGDLLVGVVGVGSCHVASVIGAVRSQIRLKKPVTGTPEELIEHIDRSLVQA